jgi:predicted nucleotide-binding protein (sugar kinase/HSP70/actin superfamily)
MDESYITKLVNDIQNERNKLFNDLKNDTELQNSNTINQKLSCLDTMLKSVFKLRNIQIKEKLTFKM